MKKILSLAMVALLLISIIPTTMATNTTTASSGTRITSTGTQSEAYIVTVPMTLEPGQTGHVTASGSWAANKTLKVSCSNSVNLYNGDEKMTVGVTFNGLQLKGDNANPIEETSAAITIETIDTSTFFGTWTGVLTYTVEMITEELVLSGSATFADGTTLSWEELQLAENSAEYGYNETVITNTNIGDLAFYECAHLTNISIPEGITDIGSWAFYGCYLNSITIPNSVKSIGDRAFWNCTNLYTINFNGTIEQWENIELGSQWKESAPVMEVICLDGSVALS